MHDYKNNSRLIPLNFLTITGLLFRTQESIRKIIHDEERSNFFQTYILILITGGKNFCSMVNESGIQNKHIICSIE